MKTIYFWLDVGSHIEVIKQRFFPDLTSEEPTTLAVVDSVERAEKMVEVLYRSFCEERKSV